MNLVFLSSCSTAENYILRRLRERWHVSAVVQVDWAKRESKWRRLRSAPIDTLVRYAEYRLFYRRAAETYEAELRQRLNDGLEALPPMEAIRVSSTSVNSKKTAELLRGLAPDLLVVCRAPILKPSIYTIPRLGTINIHPGIVPDYRGNDPVFWTLYHGDYGRLGVTIHYLDEGIDTGSVLGRGFVGSEPGDTEASVLARCARMSGDMLDAILPALDGGPPGRFLAATGQGREYRSRDRRAWHDLRWRLRRRFLSGERPKIPVRMELYLDGPAELALPAEIAS